MMTNTWRVLHLNEDVRIKLKFRGLAEYMRRIERINASLPEGTAPLPLEPPMDDEGYHHTSLWMLMSDFGHLMKMGYDVPFEMEIMTQEKNHE